MPARIYKAQFGLAVKIYSVWTVILNNNTIWLVKTKPQNKQMHRLVPSSVGRALGSHYAKYATRITLFYQGKIAIIGVYKEIQMSIYPGKGSLTCLLSNVVKKVGVRGCISG